MTLHWWQHWFWITGRAPVVGVGALLCLLLAGCDVLGQQQPSWGRGLPPGALPLAVPVALSLWPGGGGVGAGAGGEGGGIIPRRAERRLLGFAEPTVAEEGGLAASRGPAAPSLPTPSEAPPGVVTYLTTLGPGPGPGLGPGLSAREPKAIGAPPPSSAAPRPSISVLEIVEELTASASPPAPSASSATSTAETGAEDEAAGLLGASSSAEMPNDEPARGSDASSTTTEPTSEEASRVTPTLSSSLPGPGPTPRQPVQAMSLTTAPAGPSQASVADSSRPGTLGVLNLVPTSITTTFSPSSPSSSPSSSATPATVDQQGSGSAPVVVHPGVSTISRSPPTATTSTASAATSSVTPGAQTSTVEPPNVLRSAPATLSVSSASASSDRRPRPGGGPGAMSLSTGGGLDAGSITGIVLGIVVFVGLVGTVSFVLYRRRYINKPQTLNDKCSNPDSSGYIDDSTLRENSEEMYSLDNDSFLNSLEAMTIQNYWTDTVKHTKL